MCSSTQIKIDYYNQGLFIAIVCGLWRYTNVIYAFALSNYSLTHQQRNRTGAFLPLWNSIRFRTPFKLAGQRTAHLCRLWVCM